MQVFPELAQQTATVSFLKAHPLVMARHERPDT